MNKKLDQYVGLICGAAFLVVMTATITSWIMERSHKQHLDAIVAAGTKQAEELNAIRTMNSLMFKQTTKTIDNHNEVYNLLSRQIRENKAFEERVEVLFREIRMGTIDFNVCIEGLDSHSEAIAIALAKRQKERNTLRFLFNPNNRHVRVFRN